jgi:hypothetical protein
VRPNPDFNAINMPVNAAKTDYDGLNFMLEKRWSQNYTYRVSHLELRARTRPARAFRAATIRWDRI